MAHSYEEPSARDLTHTDTDQELDITTTGDTTRITIGRTTLHIPTHNLPHLAAWILAEWQDHNDECDCDDDCDCDDGLD